MVRRGLTPLLLAAAAADLADEAGFQAVTPSAVARRVGIAVPSLYAHVVDAQDLRTRVALLALQELADEAAAALAGRAGRSALAALGEVHLSYAQAHPGRWEATKLRLDAATAAASSGPRLARLLRDSLRGYGLSGDDETHAVRLLGSTLRGFVDLEGAGAFSHSAPGSDLSWTRILDALDATFTAWPTPPRGAPS